MAGFSHTPTCRLSKQRSCLGTGKKQPTVWLKYACSVEVVLLYPSFGAPLVLFLPPFGDMEDLRYTQGGYTEVSRRMHDTSTEVSRRCNGDGTEMARRSHREPTEAHISTNLRLSGNKIGLVDLHTNIHRLMKICSLEDKTNCTSNLSDVNILHTMQAKFFAF